MTDPVITVRISPNERATAPERFDMCVMEATHRGFEVVPDAGAEVDLVFSLGGRTLGIDLKMPQDLIGSLQPGSETGECHLSTQRRNCPYAFRVAVLGSLGDVMRALPTVTTAGWRNPQERVQAEGMILRGIDTLQASGVEVDFGWSPLDMPRMRTEVAEEWALEVNVEDVMRRAEYVLRSKIDLPRARCESAQEAMLRCLPTIGPEKARAMLGAGCAIRLFYGANAAIPSELETIPGIGKKTAAKILEALRE